MRTVTFEINTLVGKVGKAWKAAHLMECCSTMPSIKAAHSSEVIILALMAGEKAVFPALFKPFLIFLSFLSYVFFGALHTRERERHFCSEFPCFQIPLSKFLL